MIIYCNVVDFHLPATLKTFGYYISNVNISAPRRMQKVKTAANHNETQN